MKSKISIAECPEVVPDEPRREVVEAATGTADEEVPGMRCCCFGAKARSARKPAPAVPMKRQPAAGALPESSTAEARKGSILKRRLSADSAKCVDASEQGLRESVKQSLEAAAAYAEEQGHYVPRSDSTYG